MNNNLLPPPSLDDLNLADITYVDNIENNFGEFSHENNFEEEENASNLIEPLEIITVPIKANINDSETPSSDYLPPSPNNAKNDKIDINVESENDTFDRFTQSEYSVEKSTGEEKLKKYNKISLFIQQYKYELYCTLNYLVIYFTFGISLSSLGPALKVLQYKTNTEAKYIGLLFVTRGLGFIAGSMFTGKVIDFIQRSLNDANFVSFSVILRTFLIIFSPHRIPMYSIAICSFAYLNIAFVTNFYVLNFFVFLTGLSGGILDVCNNTYIMWAWREKSSAFLQFIHFGFGVGALCAGFLFGFFQFFYDEPTAVQIGFIIIAVVSFPMGLGIFFVRSPSPAPISPSDSSDDHLSAAEADLPSTTSSSNIFSEYTSYILVIILSGAYLFIYVGAESGYAGWVYSYAVDMEWMSSMQADYLTSGFWVTFTLFRFISIFISSKVTASFILIVCTLFCFCSMVFLSVAQYLYLYGYLSVFQASLSLWFASLALGAGTSACYPSCIGLPGELGKRVTATSTSVMVLSASAGEMICALLVALFYTLISPHTFPLYFVGLFMIGAVVIASILFTGNVPFSRWFTVFHSSGSNLVNYSPSGASVNVELETAQHVNDDGSPIIVAPEERTFKRLFYTMKERFIEDENVVEGDDDDHSYDNSQRSFRIPI